MYFLHQVLSLTFPPLFLRYVETKTLNVKRYYVMRSLLFCPPSGLRPSFLLII